jgi:uncharacterized membrane protein
MKTNGLQHSGKNQKFSGLAQGLGWFSVALGAAELILPGGLASLVGVRPRSLLFRILGLRELASGVGILTRPNSAPWLWSRVAGDAMDLALLGTALASPGAKQSRVAAATAAVVGVTVLDVLASQQQSRNGKAVSSASERGIHIKKTIIIDRSPQELYHYWRNFENLPRFMYHLESVQVTNPTRSHWVAKAPAGTRVEWDSEVTQDIPNELIAWRSLGGSDVDHSGTVRFSYAPGNRGTMVAVDMVYDPPGGRFGAAVAKLFHREPRQQIEDALRFFKQLIETGMVVTTKGQPVGRASSTSKKFDYKVPHVPSGEFAHS